MTANDLGAIPGPLRDRMEIIHIAGYTPEEKFNIAKRYLLPKAIETHGLKNYPVTLSDKIFMQVVRGYTKEAGVRELERLMNTIARKIATEVVTEDVKEGRKFAVNEKALEKYLGPMKFERTDREDQPQVGLVNGLAWTSVGGELLNIEVVTVPGNGKIQVTGNLKDVMRESASAALSYIRSISPRLGIDHEWYHQLRMKYGMPIILNDILTTSRIRDDRVSAQLESQYDIVIEANPIGKKLINAMIADAILKFEKSTILTYLEKREIVNKPVREPSNVEPI